MKTTIRNCSLIIMIFMVSWSKTMATDSLIVVHENKSVTTDQGISGKAHKFRLYIKNQKGQILHEETMEEGNFFTTAFDFEGLPNGSYQAELIGALRTQMLPMSVLDGKLITHYDELEVLYDPVVTQREKSILLNMYSPQKSTLKVKIYDQNGKLIYMSSIKGQGNLGKSFDFSEVDSGSYKMLLANNGRDYTKIIQVL